MKPHPFWIVQLVREQAVTSDMRRWPLASVIACVKLDPEQAELEREAMTLQATRCIDECRQLIKDFRQPLIDALDLPRGAVKEHRRLLKLRDAKITAHLEQLRDHRWQREEIWRPVVFAGANWGYYIRHAFDDPTEPVQ